MLTEGYDSAVAIFEITGSYKSGIPSGQGRPVWPAGKGFMLSPPHHFCPSRFRISPGLGEALVAPCTNPDIPICKFTGFGGYSCCDRIKGGSCSDQQNCDAALGLVKKQNRCACKDGFVSNGETGDALRCKYEDRRSVEARTYPDYDMYANDDYVLQDDYNLPSYDRPVARAYQMDDYSQGSTTTGIKKNRALPTITSSFLEDYPNEIKLKNTDNNKNKPKKHKNKSKAELKADNDLFFCFGKGCEPNVEEKPIIEISTPKSRKTASREELGTNNTPIYNPQNIEDHRQIIENVLSSRAAIRTTTAPEVEEELTEAIVEKYETENIPKPTKLVATFIKKEPNLKMAPMNGPTILRDTLDQDLKNFMPSIVGSNDPNFVILPINENLRPTLPPVVLTTTSTTMSTTTIATTFTTDTTTETTTTEATTTTDLTTTLSEAVYRWSTEGPSSTTTSKLESTTTTTTTSTELTLGEIFTEWSDWSECRASCGAGVQSRTRLCLDFSRCELPIESEDKDCDAGICQEDLTILQTYLSHSDALMAVRAIEENNVHLLQILLYNNDINVMMYQMLTRRAGPPSIRQLLSDFTKVKTVNKPTEPATVAPAQFIPPVAVLKSANKNRPSPSSPPSPVDINRAEADYVIGKLIEDHLSKSIRHFPKK